MNRNLIFAIVLLATLSMVNAIPHQLHKRATTFAPCPAAYADAITVTIQPDPPVSGQNLIINTSGTLSNGTIDTGSSLIFDVMDNTGAEVGTPVTSDICTTSGITCPIAPGSSFSLTNTVMVGTLPAAYTIVVTVTDPTSSPIACAMGTITG